VKPQYGAAGALPAGYVRIPTGTLLWRGHTPGWNAAYFGPAVGAVAVNRFDIHQRLPTDPGTCYLARSLDGVLLERVLRGAVLPVLSERRLRTAHAVCRAFVATDLVLVDLVRALSTVYALQLSAIVAPPVAGAPPYPPTSHLAHTFAQGVGLPPLGQAAPRVDGIFYASRWGPAALCIALWDRAASSITWGPSGPLDRQHVPQLASAANRLGIGLIP